MSWNVFAGLKDRFKGWFTLDLKKVDWERSAYLVGFVIILAFYLKAQLMPEFREVQTTVFQKAKPIKGTATIKRVMVPCSDQGIATYDKQAIADKLNLPWLQGGNLESADDDTESSDEETREEVIPPSAEGTPRLTADGDIIKSPVAGKPSDLEVVATGDLLESRNGYDLLGIWNRKTGVIDLTSKEKDSPWFDFRNKYGLGIRYGVAVGDGLPHYSGTVYGYWEFLRTKDLYWMLYGEGTTDGTGKVEADMQYRGGK